MKKMIIMMAVAVLAMAANAATVTWSVTGTKAPVGGGDGTFSVNALNGGIAYLFVGAQNNAALVSAVEGKTFTGAGNLWSQATSSTGAITKAGLGNYSNQDVTLYMVIFDKGTIAGSSFYMISTDYTQTFTTLAKTYAFTTASGRLPTQWTAIPEPTAMALLALGAAAVGLRRKFVK